METSFTGRGGIAASIFGGRRVVHIEPRGRSSSSAVYAVTLDDGSTVTADVTYLHDAIMSPNKQVVDGYSPIMPDFSAQLDDQKVADIIAYIQSLQ